MEKWEGGSVKIVCICQKLNNIDYSLDVRRTHDEIEKRVQNLISEIT